MSIRKFFEDFYRENGVDIPEKVKSTSSYILKILGLFNRNLKEYEKVLYQSRIDWTVDDSKFRSSFPDFKSTPLKVAYRETYDWFKENN